MANVAAAAANVAANAALQAKLMAEEAQVMLCQDTPASILKGEGVVVSSSSVLNAAREASKKRVEAATTAIKQAENLNSIVEAAELASEAVSQAERLVSICYLPSINEVVEAGQSNYLKHVQESGVLEKETVASLAVKNEFDDSLKTTDGVSMCYLPSINEVVEAGPSYLKHVQESGVLEKETVASLAVKNEFDDSLKTTDGVSMCYLPSINEVVEAGPSNYLKHVQESGVLEKETVASLAVKNEFDDSLKTTDGVSGSVSASRKEPNGQKDPKAVDLAKNNATVIDQEDGSTSLINNQNESEQMETTNNEDIKEGSTVEVFKEGPGIMTARYTTSVLSLKDDKACVAYNEPSVKQGIDELKDRKSLKGKGDDAPKIRAARSKEDMSTSKSGSKEEKKADQVVEANPLANKEDSSGGAIVLRSEYSKPHKFWETQPVGQFKDIGDTSLLEGPIEPTTPLSEVKQEPYNFASDLEWTTCDMNSEDMCSQVYNFFKANYPDERYMFRVDYSREFLRWALCPPGYEQSWHIGVRVKTTKKLVAFISGVPARIKVRDEVVNMAKINFLCVHKRYRSKAFATAMINEMTRRVHLKKTWQAVYTSPDILPTPFTSCQYWGRELNPEKLIDVGYSALRGEKMTISRAVRLYKLPDAPITPGFKAMEIHDISAVTRLLRNYLSRFGVATLFDERDVEHYFLPRENVIDSYVVVSPKTLEVTDFCSFYVVPFTISSHPRHTTVKCAYLYYNVAETTPSPKLMKDALIVSKQKGLDVFYALDVMHNKSFFEELKFARGDDAELHYYLYNYRLRALNPSDVGVVMW